MWPFKVEIRRKCRLMLTTVKFNLIYNCSVPIIIIHLVIIITLTKTIIIIPILSILLYRYYSIDIT